MTESRDVYRVIVRTPDGDRPVEGDVTRDKGSAEAIRSSMERLARSKGWALSYRIEKVIA